MKTVVTKTHCVEDVEKYLYPVKQFGEEKLRKGMYDDWNEAAHTLDWLNKVLSSIQNGGEDELVIYYLAENDRIIASAFALMNSKLTIASLGKDGIIPDPGKIAHVTCFHVLEAYRGKGLGSSWLTGEIFGDLRARGVAQVYIRSSHNSALSLYEKLGTKVGNYISVSDSKLYQRYGYIYKIDL